MFIGGGVNGIIVFWCVHNEPVQRMMCTYFTEKNTYS
jgi:hypothetical protein